MGGGVCSLANCRFAYEETQSNRVSDFRDFLCVLFPKAIFFTFTLSAVYYNGCHRCTEHHSVTVYVFYVIEIVVVKKLYHMPRGIPAVYYNYVTDVRIIILFVCYVIEIVVVKHVVPQAKWYICCLH